MPIARAVIIKPRPRPGWKQSLAQSILRGSAGRAIVRHVGLEYRLFPLTPTLSPEEREPTRPCSCKLRALRFNMALLTERSPGVLRGNPFGV